VYSDRIIAVKFKAEPVSILIVQVYMPTSDYEDNEVEEMFDIIEEILEEDGKGETNTIVMGDSNSVVGNKAHHNTVRPYGLGRRNQRGQMLIDFCERNGFVITNTWFKKPKRRLYTWKSPGDKSRYQLDDVLVKQRFRNSVKDVQTLPGADIDSDHNLLFSTICTRLKKIIRFHKRKPRQDLEKLCAQRQEVHNSLEETLVQSNVKVGM
jgi:exonuclease III